MRRNREVEVETDHDEEGLVPVDAGCGTSGRRERAARAGSANESRKWAARAGGASRRRERAARDDVQTGRYWGAIGEISAPGPLGAAGWLGGGPKAVPRCLGRSYGGLGGHLVIWTAFLP